MSKPKSRLFGSEALRNTGRLFSANVIAQAIGLVIYPLLTRLYSTSDFGLLNLFVSLNGVLVIAGTLEWHNGIVLPKSRKEARALVHICFLPLAALVVLLLLTVPFSRQIASVFNTPDLARFYWLLPLCVALTGTWNILNYWYIRHKQYRRISGYQMSQSVFSAVYKSGFGALEVTSGGLLFSTVLAPLCSLLLSISLAWKKHIRPLMHADTDIWKQTAAQYSNFPKFSFPRSTLNYVAGQLPVLVLTPVFGADKTGLWGMALLLAFAPVSMLTRALYQVLYQHTTERVNDGKHISSYIFRFTRLTLLVAIPGFTALYFILPWLTEVFLGSEWRTTGEYIRWMLPWLICTLLTSSTCFIADVFFKQKQGLYFEIVLAVARCASVAAGILAGSFEVTVAAYALSSAMVIGTQFLWLVTLVRRYEKRLQQPE